MRLAEEVKLRNQMSAQRAKAEAERNHQVREEQPNVANLALRKGLRDMGNEL